MAPPSITSPGRGPRRRESRAKAEKQSQALIQPFKLTLRNNAEDTSDAPLVHRAQMVDERVGSLGQTAGSRLKRRIKRPFTWRPGHWHDGDQWEALVGNHIWIANHHARADSALLVADRGV